MTSPVYLRQPSIQRIEVVLQEVHSGSIQIPRFQRPFVWTDEQRLQLLDSIRHGFPIGSLLVWRTDSHRLRVHESLGPFDLPGQDAGSPGHARQYLFDGHQRITTLYTTFAPSFYPEEGGDEELERIERHCREQGFKWPLFYDLEQEDFRLPPVRGKAPDTWLSLATLLDSVLLYEETDRLRQLESGDRLVRRAQNLASTFRDYTIPVVPIVTGELEVVTESFQRVNSAGTQMSEVHMINALTWQEDFDLNEELERIGEELGAVGWQELEPKMILNTAKAALDLDIYKSEVKEVRDALRDEPAILEDVRNAISRAAVFLRDACNIHGPRMLPYSYQIVLLARIALEEDALTDDAVRDRLEKWVWATTFGEYYGGVNSTLLRKSLEHLEEVASTEPTDGEPVSPIPRDMSEHIRPLNRFDTRAARSRAVALMMAERNPLDAEGEETHPLENLALHGPNAIQKLFTPRSLRERGAGEAPQYLSDGPANRFICSPKSATALQKRLLDVDDLPAARVLRSHLIDEEAEEHLRDGDILAFLERRDAAIMDLEQARVEATDLTYEREPRI